MKDCIICGAMIQFYGNDGICKACQSKINARHQGAKAFEIGYNLCLNPFVFGAPEFLAWIEGWEEQHAKSEHDNR